MKSSLPATHLLKIYLLFALTVLFLLTLVRTVYGIWQLPKFEQVDTVLNTFGTGLRFDLSVIGTILLVPVVLFTLLAMMGFTRALSKGLIVAWLSIGLLFVLLSELITPYFMAEQGLRPDMASLGAINNPVQFLASLWSSHLIPAVIGIVLCVLIMIAFINRLELRRMLRFRINPFSGVLLMVVGGALCVLAIWSGIDPKKPPLHPGDALISEDRMVNEIALNSPFKVAYSMVSSQLPSSTTAAAPQ